MSAPTKKTRRDYRDREGKRLPGVTTILGETLGWSKTGLMMWAAKEAAKFAVAALGDGGAPDEVVERARKAHLKVRDAAAEAGTLAHAYVEIFLRTGISPVVEDIFIDEDETRRKARAAFEKFRAWWPTSGYEVVDVEIPLVDADCGYGGTVDLLLRRKSDGALVVGDLKSGRSVYDEVLIQLGAYSVLLGLHGHHVESGVVVHMPVEGDPNIAVIERRVLEMGAKSFASLLYVYKSRSSLKLDLSDLGGVP